MENLGRGALVIFIDERNYKASLITRRAISSRIDSNQTYNSLSYLEHLARKWATELPKRWTWVKLQTQKPKAINKTSWITWPYSR